MTPTAARVIYPELPDPLTPSDLQQLFSPSFDERNWDQTVTRAVESHVALLVQLKIFQSTGRFRRAADVPHAATDHVAHRMGVESGSSVISLTERFTGIARLSSNVLKWFRGAPRHVLWPRQRCARPPKRVPTPLTSSIRRLTHSFGMTSNCRLSLRYAGWPVPRTATLMQPNGPKCVACLLYTS